MSTAFDNVESAFASSVSTSTVPRWQRKAMENVNARTPSKESCDRFIPNRKGMDMDAAHFHLTNADGSENIEAGSPSKSDFQRNMRNNLMNSDEASKILAFKQRAPMPREGYQNDLRVLYTQNRTTMKARKASRVIPQSADKILDAPGILSNFYLNLLDWSQQNMIAVALGEAVYVWDPSTGDVSELCHTDSPNDYISSVSWAQDGAHLAVGTADSAVHIWDVTAQRKVRTLAGHSGRVAAMDWNQHVLSSGSQCGQILNSDVRQRDHVIQTLQGHSQEVCGLKWSPDGKLLASGGNDNLVNIWTAAGEQRHTLTHHQAAVKALAWCPWQSNLLATGGGTNDRHIRFWNTTSGNCLNSIDTKSQVSSLLWNKEHKELISGHGFSNNQLTIWKYPSLTRVAELTGHSERVLSMAMSPDGQTVASAGGDETLRFWNCFASDARKKAKKTVEPTMMGAFIR